VGKKGNKQWIRLTLDRKTRVIVEFTLVIAAKNRQKIMGVSTPVYRQCAVCYRFWTAYEEILPTKRHKAVGKRGKTTTLNDLTIQQRISV